MLEINEIKEEAGYAEIRLNKVDIVTNSDIIIHVIDKEEIITILDNFSNNINELDERYRDILQSTIGHLRNRVQTLVTQEKRVKRGLINAVGTVSKWMFGTMDDQDRSKIEEHIKNLNNKEYQLEINSLKQVRINDHFNRTFEQIKQIIESDRVLIVNQLNSIKNQNVQGYLYLDQLFKIQLLKDRIEHILDNIASARHGIIHPNILTDEEIKEYNIDFHKLQYIKLGVAKSGSSLLMFAIKVPKTFETVQLKIIMPMPNNNFKEIYSENEIVFEYSNQVYHYENSKTINELAISKHCVFYKNCNLVRNNKTEIIEIDEETIVIKNAIKLKIYQNCDERNVTINGNVLIHYNNCTIKILNQKFSNVKAEYHERFHYPKGQNYSNFVDKLTFEDIIFENEQNSDKIENLDHHKNISYMMDFLIICGLIVLLIILMRNKIRTLYRIQENSNLKGGVVTYAAPRATFKNAKVQNLEDDRGPQSACTLPASNSPEKLTEFLHSLGVV